MREQGTPLCRVALGIQHPHGKYAGRAALLARDQPPGASRESKGSQMMRGGLIGLVCLMLLPWASARADDGWYSAGINGCQPNSPSRFMIGQRKLGWSYTARDTVDPLTGQITSTTVDAVVAGEQVRIIFYHGKERCQAAVDARQDTNRKSDEAVKDRYGEATPPKAPPDEASVLDSPGVSQQLSETDRAIDEVVRRCWTYDPESPQMRDVEVTIIIKMDDRGVVRQAEVADNTNLLRNPDYRAFAERVRRTFLDPRCANMPEQVAAAGKPRVLLVAFTP